MVCDFRISEPDSEGTAHETVAGAANFLVDTLQFDLTRDCVDERVNANHGKVTVILQECQTAKYLKMLTNGKKHQKLAFARAGIPCAFKPFHAEHGQQNIDR